MTLSWMSKRTIEKIRKLSTKFRRLQAKSYYSKEIIAKTLKKRFDTGEYL